MFYAKTLGKYRVLEKMMFKDMFNFGKTRTLKESIGFFIFHTTLVVTVMAALKLSGLS